MFITHPRLATAYALGSFGLVVSYLLVDEYKLNNAHVREMCVLDTKNTHDKYIADKNEKMLYATHSHEKHMLDHSRWWKRSGFNKL